MLNMFNDRGTPISTIYWRISCKNPEQFQWFSWRNCRSHTSEMCTSRQHRLSHAPQLGVCPEHWSKCTPFTNQVFFLCELSTPLQFPRCMSGYKPHIQVYRLYQLQHNLQSYGKISLFSLYMYTPYHSLFRASCRLMLSFGISLLTNATSSPSWDRAMLCWIAEVMLPEVREDRGVFCLVAIYCTAQGVLFGGAVVPQSSFGKRFSKPNKMTLVALLDLYTHVLNVFLTTACLTALGVHKLYGLKFF